MENADNLPEGEYEVEKILNYRKRTKFDEKTKQNSVVEEYLIKWLNYDEKSWEPVSNLDNCQELLNEFKKKMKKKIPSKSKKKTSKSKTPRNSSKNINKKILQVKEKSTGIAKVPKSCLKTPKPKKKKSQKKAHLQKNNSDNSIKTKTEGISLKQEIIPRIPNKEKKDEKDKNKENCPENNKKNIIENYDKNRYVLYRGQLVERPIIFDFDNIIPARSIPAKKSIYDQLTFEDIFPDDKFGKLENSIGKKRKRNESLNSSANNKGVNDNFISPSSIKKLI